MATFLLNNSLNIVCVAAGAVFVHLLLSWSKITTLQRLVRLQFFFVALHINEELRFPGGFVSMVEEKLGFTLTNPQFGELVLSIVVLAMFIPPLLFPKRPFLAMPPMVLGVFELVAHTGGIWMFDRDIPYTPGLATAACLLAPVGFYSIHHAVKNKLIKPGQWLLVALYMLFIVAIAQQIVVRSTGMSYLEFLNNVRRSLRGG